MGTPADAPWITIGNAILGGIVSVIGAIIVWLFKKRSDEIDALKRSTAAHDEIIRQHADGITAWRGEFKIVAESLNSTSQQVTVIADRMQDVRSMRAEQSEFVHQVIVLVEQQSELNRQITQQWTKIDANKEKIGELKTALEVLRTEVQSLSKGRQHEDRPDRAHS